MCAHLFILAEAGWRRWETSRGEFSHSPGLSCSRCAVPVRFYKRFLSSAPGKAARGALTGRRLGPQKWRPAAVTPVLEAAPFGFIRMEGVLMLNLPKPLLETRLCCRLCLRRFHSSQPLVSL